jgi:hypothetical protein
MSVQSDSFYFSAWFYHSMCEDIANYWFKLSNKRGIKCSESELEQYKQSTIEIIKRALNSGELPVYSKPDFAFVSPDNRKTASPDEVMFYSDIKRVLDKARPFNPMPDLPIFMADYQEMETLLLEAQANIKKTSTAIDIKKVTAKPSLEKKTGKISDKCILSIGVEQLDFNNAQNNKSRSLSTHFNNVGLTGDILSKENLFNYLSENGFTTLRTHYFKRLKYYEQKAKTPIMLTVSMCMKGESIEFEKKLNPLMSKINNGEKLTNETQGEIKPFLLEGWKKSELDPIQKEALEINKLDLSNSGMARFLDSDYSIDTFINWLESKQLDIPHAIFKLVDEVKGWNENLNNAAIINKIDIEKLLTADTDINNPKFLKSEKQIIAILKAIKIKQWQPLEIPDGGKGTIKQICENDYPKIFDCTSSFDEAWRKRDKTLIRMANHASYSKRGKQ